MNVFNQREKLQELANNDASVKQYRQQLQSYYQTLSEFQAASYGAYSELKGVLNRQQKQELKNSLADICPYYDEKSESDEYMGNYHHGRMHHNGMHNW